MINENPFNKNNNFKNLLTNNDYAESKKKYSNKLSIDFSSSNNHPNGKESKNKIKEPFVPFKEPYQKGKVKDKYTIKRKTRLKENIKINSQNMINNYEPSHEETSNKIVENSKIKHDEIAYNDLQENQNNNENTSNHVLQKEDYYYNTNDFAFDEEDFIKSVYDNNQQHHHTNILYNEDYLDGFQTIDDFKAQNEYFMSLQNKNNNEDNNYNNLYSNFNENNVNEINLYSDYDDFNNHINDFEYNSNEINHFDFNNEENLFNQNYEDEIIENLLDIELNDPVREYEEYIINEIYPDPDNMTYDQMMELEEQMGVVSKALPKEKLKKIKVMAYNKRNIEKLKLKQDSCCICMEKFKENEKIRFIKCNHIFHKFCLDEWLSKAKTCPLCKVEVA